MSVTDSMHITGDLIWHAVSLPHVLIKSFAYILQEEVVVQAPANDGQSNAIKQRAAELRRMLQQRLGPVIFER